MRFSKYCALVLAFLLLSGCSVYMAANQPPAKNIDLFKVGTPRSALLAEFGYPTSTETKADGKKYDIYRFTQGYSGGAKAGRAVLHGVADVLTLGLWEVIGTPVEAVNDGNLTAYEVSYGKDDRVDQVISLIQPAPTATAPNQSNVPPAFRDQPPAPEVPKQVADAPVVAPQVTNSIPLPNPADKLDQLDQMRKKGLITQKDYDSKKAEILKSL